MSEQINIGEWEGGTVSMDLARLLETRALIQAGSGGGKSWLLRRFIEQCWGKVHLIIIDPEGEFVTLAEKFDVIVAGQDGDVPLSVDTAGKLAEAVMKNQVNIVCDIYEMPPDQRHAWVRNFIMGLINLPRPHWHKVVVILDEAHMFAPEKGQGESVALGPIVDLVSRGRKRGLCTILATQRLGKLNKNVAAELQNVIIGSTTLDIDRERASDSMGISRKDKPEFFKQIKSFNPGEFYMLGPAFGSNEVAKFKSGSVSTTHAREIGQAVMPPKHRAKGAFAGIIAEVAAAAATKEMEPTPVAGGGGGHREDAIPDPQVEVLKQRVALLEGEVGSLKAALDCATELMRKTNVLAGQIQNLSAPISTPAVESHKEVAAPSQEMHLLRPAPPRPRVAAEKQEPGGLGKCHKVIMSLLYLNRNAGCTNLMLVLLGGYGYNSAFRNALSELRTSGLLQGSNMERMLITETGVMEVKSGRAYAEIPRGEDLWRMWLAKYGRCHVLILESVRAHDGHAGPKLAELNGYGYNSAFRNALSELRTANLIVGKNMGGISLAPVLRKELG